MPAPDVSAHTLLETQALKGDTVGTALSPGGGFQLFLDVTCRSNIQEISCPTHSQHFTVVASDCNLNMRQARLINIGVLDRDIVVLIREATPHPPRACIEVCRHPVTQENGDDEPNQDATRAMTTTTGVVTPFPKIEFPDSPAREFIFVVDRSGSMAGYDQIEHARTALLLFLRALPPSCAFNIVGFGSTYQTLFETSEPYNDETLETASQYVSSMQADLGGTELLLPLQWIFSQNTATEAERQVFVLTDGQVSNDLQVFDLIRSHCSAPKQGRLFAVGI